MDDARKRALFSELRFRAVRSGGSGGQHVNKVSSKVILEFDIASSTYLEEDEKRLIYSRLRSRINSEGMLQVSAQDDRSQHRNKEIAIKRFYSLLEEALKVEKKRVKTKIPSSVRAKRLKQKKMRSEIKKLRGRGFGAVE